MGRQAKIKSVSKNTQGIKKRQAVAEWYVQMNVKREYMLKGERKRGGGPVQFNKNEVGRCSFAGNFQHHVRRPSNGI